MIYILFVSLGDDRCLAYRVDRQSEYQWVSYEEVQKITIKFYRN
jgi:hypothetical protein